MGSSCRIAGLVMVGVFLCGPSGAVADPADAKERQKHWAFQPVQRPELPAVSDSGWSSNPIDRFVRAKQEAVGLKPVGGAGRTTLIRRLYMDLIGLPPEPEAVRAFVDDPSPSAVEKLVDRLLARPQYGERWARHWLDVVRYGETNGYERDGEKPSAWRYRDYVIDAFNRDKPYDRFLTEQLAGDEIDGTDASSQIATTFLRLGTWDDEPADPLVDRYDQLDDVLGTTATAFLGITLRCARCHDHKFEPFSQADYYRMLAVFEPLKRPQDDRDELDRPVGTEAERSANRAALAQADAEFAALWRRIEALLRPEIDRLLAPPEQSRDGKPIKSRTSLSSLVVATLKLEIGKRTEGHWVLVRAAARQILAEARQLAPDEVKAALKPLDERLAALEAARPKELPHAYIWDEVGPKAPITHVLKRGDPTRPGAVVEPGVPAVLASGPLGAPFSTSRSTGRRLWLTRWLTDRKNPLVARVIVNRIWQYHFGQGLVASSSDFGVMGDDPSHPELIDWLASELIRSGWRLKPLHRLIVLSRTYGLSSDFDPAAAELDPGDTLLWRWRPRRLEAEVVRDSILAASGRLNPRMRGPGMYPTLPAAVLAGQSKPGDGWGKSDEFEQCRRSIYIFAKRSLGVPELDLLDAPDNTSSCERRIVSTTGPQALTFLNGRFIHEQARFFAARLVSEAGAARGAQVHRAFELVLGRAPRPDEARAALEFLAGQEKQIEHDLANATIASTQVPRDPRSSALESLCLVILNMNEFAYMN
jgi:Protein of unknown function (DUF1553)/Protein of unknown function (DUF1549)